MITNREWSVVGEVNWGTVDEVYVDDEDGLVLTLDDLGLDDDLDDGE